MSNVLPTVLLSREAAAAAAGLPAPPKLSLTPSGTTFTMAQEAAWLDGEHYAVGRWDGSMSIFNFTAGSPQGPVIAKAFNSPAHEGVQMITSLQRPGVFASSNDDGSMIAWHSAEGRSITPIGSTSPSIRTPCRSSTSTSCGRNPTMVASFSSVQPRRERSGWGSLVRTASFQ
jgi:hypothetical protein